MCFRSLEGYRNMGISHLPLKILRYLYCSTSYCRFGPRSLVLKCLQNINKQSFCDVEQVTTVYMVDSPLIVATVG